MKRLCGLIAVAAFVAAGCNKAPEPAAPAAAAFTPTAHGSLKQLMRAIPFPASNIIFDAQTNDPGKPVKAGDASGNASAQYGGIAEYAGWNAVENAGVALQETANLIMIPGRKCGNGQPVPNDQADFKQWAADLATVGAEVTAFAQKKTYNEDAVGELTGKVSDACQHCHDKYRNTPKEPDDRCMVGGAAPAAAK
ncbi:MAG TPA: cytochrome c [Vicinamibacterales bacterium]|jgi:hypothetical protein|nr:cytochrome c [Vicinamibacterales bacterium]